MTTREKNELKKLQRKKEVRRQYEKIAIILGVIIVIVFAGKMILGKKKSVPTAGNVETSQKQTIVKKTIVETTVQEETTRAIDPNKPMIALTFDDGPGQYTGKLLDALEKYNARASFFMCGYSLKRTDIPVDKLLKRMDALGCDLGNHTMNHCALDKVSKSKRKYEINGVNELVKKAVGYNPKFLRPPYGSGIRDADVQKAAKMPIVCWSVDTLDWKTKSKKETVKSIMNSAKDGQIILMHDIHSWSVDAAIEAIPKLQKKGYQIVSVSEMAEAKGVKLKSHILSLNKFNNNVDINKAEHKVLRFIF